MLLSEGLVRLINMRHSLWVRHRELLVTAGAVHQTWVQLGEAIHRTAMHGLLSPAAALRGHGWGAATCRACAFSAAAQNSLLAPASVTALQWRAAG